ncbi:uncharacterized protein SCHCODRAFT_02070818 [Schizophyllum commune H4-8]|uniref:uncharacterized protein n=1 Tax=Schizophyllum commune (strain H4-8 / FGSC 9210) TaxID=578458 RepID=UPI002160B3F8|nr:uncharacterized protein SCHCODRAFT_02070818 [Schizophyllum commune H4-8]KAI5887705.1 hypothetical protein SCHCODRAFT_02070818 [Schizophyllum commune H4-8]
MRPPHPPTLILRMITPPMNRMTATHTTKASSPSSRAWPIWTSKATILAMGQNTTALWTPPSTLQHLFSSVSPYVCLSIPVV